MSPTDDASGAAPATGTDPAPAEPLLTVQGLRKSFGDHEVLRTIDLTVHRGQVLALIGPSGSG
ncbi:MAG: glutamine ABC transporter ATP-binding protein GlnQ, partial [Cellulomonadaceae bacterium]|nr:glutamine ABC transporter ATP-binding protein GlnQ [Cellulomonadaceae bacterium]